MVFSSNTSIQVKDRSGTHLIDIAMSKPLYDIRYTSDHQYVITKDSKGVVLTWDVNTEISYKQIDKSLRLYENDYIFQVEYRTEKSIRVKDSQGKHLIDIPAQSLYRSFDTVPTINVLFQKVSMERRLFGIFQINGTNVAQRLLPNLPVYAQKYPLNITYNPKSHVVHLRDKDRIRDFKGHTKMITTSANPVKGKRLATGSNDNEIIL